jgi:hypothetical protein
MFFSRQPKAYNGVRFESRPSNCYRCGLGFIRGEVVNRYLARALLRCIIEGRYCRTLLRDIIAGRYCWTLLRGIVTG